MSAYDLVAPNFDRYRAFPCGVGEAIRAAILRCASATARPRLLDLGAGSGRTGWPFVAAGDDYVGVDLSSGMLREFTRRAGGQGTAPHLVQADGRPPPVGDPWLDTWMLIQGFCRA